MSSPVTTQCLNSSYTFHPTLSSFTVTEHEYLRSNPSAQYGYIATGAVVFDAIDPLTPRVLLLQRSANDSWPNKWEIPGGGCDEEDRSILDGVVRELWEEAGLKAKCVEALVGTPQLLLSPTNNQICKFNFLVDAKGNADSRLEVTMNPEEHQKFVWATEAEVRCKRAGEIELNFTTKELEDTVLQAFEQLRVKREGSL